MSEFWDSEKNQKDSDRADFWRYVEETAERVRRDPEWQRPQRSDTTQKREDPGRDEDRHKAETGHKLEHMCCMKADWQKERGRELAPLAHYCDEWDGMTMDVLCPEWPCACVIGDAYRRGYADALKAAEERLRAAAVACYGTAAAATLIDAADEIWKMREEEK